MKLAKKIAAFEKLGKFLKEFVDTAGAEGAGNAPSPGSTARAEALNKAIEKSRHHNGWFVRENVENSLRSIADMLNRKDLEEWVEKYERKLAPSGNARGIGVVMAGNIPAVGFHDFLCIVISGHRFIGKLSGQDQFLLPALVEILVDIEPGFKELITFRQDKLTGFEAVIATGSNNTSRYFDYYFGKYPHIIRKNRNSVAILTGEEKKDQLAKLGNDIFKYFGLGCRSVSKIFVPEGYDFDNFFNGIYDYQAVFDNKKYANNYYYNRTLYLMNREENLLDNGFLILKEDVGMASPVAVLYYEHYKKKEDLAERLKMDREQIQCVVGNGIPQANVEFGHAQLPRLWDYADNCDTMDFLLSLK